MKQIVLKTLAKFKAATLEIDKLSKIAMRDSLFAMTDKSHDA